jgi:molybdopterin synthase sulfur carrier subunit
MIRIKVKPFFYLKELLGAKELILELPAEATVLEVIEELTRRSNHALKEAIIDSNTGQIKPYYRILLEGRDLSCLGGLNTKLSDGDIISLFPPVAGGN